MKHLFRGLLWCDHLMLQLQQAFAPANAAHPIDKNVRIGKLNGLTYYIRKNNLPANRADFHCPESGFYSRRRKSTRIGTHFLEHVF